MIFTFFSPFVCRGGSSRHRWIWEDRDVAEVLTFSHIIYFYIQYYSSPGIRNFHASSSQSSLLLYTLYIYIRSSSVVCDVLCASLIRKVQRRHQKKRTWTWCRPVLCTAVTELALHVWEDCTPPIPNHPPPTALSAVLYCCGTPP